MRAHHRICGIALPLLLLIIDLPARAEPYIAFREGLKCATCHVNRTGGGMRNGYGGLFTQTEIRPLFAELSEDAFDFSADLGPSLSLGADFILANETRQGPGEESSINSFGVDSGSLYLQARLIPARLTFYLDETVAPAGASSREAFVLLEGLPGAGYLKAGRMLLPYGVRMWDDAAFVRQATGFNYDNQDLGLEVGFEPGAASVAVAVSNGTQGARDDDRSKQISAVGSYWIGGAVLGASVAFNDAHGVRRLVAGPFGSVRTGLLSWTGELATIRERGGPGPDNDQLLAFASVDGWVRQAINVRLAFDYHDPFDRVEQDERSRVTLGVDAFLTPFLTASAAYHLKDSVPQDPTGNADTFTLSLHTFF